MDQTKTTMEMLFLTNKKGRIVAAAFAAGEISDTMNTALAPLPGQQLHRAEVPAVLADLNGHDLHMLLSKARIEPADSRLTLPEIKIIKRGH